MIKLELQEYDQCHHTIRVCVPHANVPYARDQLDTTREWIIYERLGLDSTVAFRADNRTHASATHDAAPKSSSIEMERHGQRERKALHRTGAEQLLLCASFPLPLLMGYLNASSSIEPSELQIWFTSSTPCLQSSATLLDAETYMESRPFVASSDDVRSRSSYRVLALYIHSRVVCFLSTAKHRA